MIKAEWISNDALSAEQTTQTNASNALNVMDCVSRQAAVSRISDLLMLELKGRRLPTWDEVNEAINELPSAQPEPRWIPVTEKTPEAYGWYLCSLKDGRTTRLYFDKRKSQWIDNAKKHMFELYDIIGKFSRVPITEELADVYWDGWVTAWMPTPKPYREEAENAQLD